MNKFFKTVCAVTLAASLVGCSSSTTEETTSDSTDSSTETSTETVKIGFIGPLTGDYAVYGVGQRNSAQLAIEEYNALGGTQFELVYEDSQGDATSAVNAYNKLVDSDGVVAILGAVLSGETAAVTSASEEAGTPIISASATAVEATTPYNAFRGCFTDPMQAEAMASEAIALGYTSAGIIYNVDSDYSVGLTDSFTAQFESEGGTVVIAEGYSDGDKDFNSQLTNILNAGVDCLYVPNYYSDNALIAQQAAELGLDVQLLGGDGWDGVIAVSEDTSSFEGALFTNGYSPDDESIQEYITKYTEAYGEEPNNFAFLAYDATYALLYAYDNAETKDNEGIVAAMYATDYDGILGNLTFDENGDPVREISIVTVSDGEYASYN